jgi:glycosyltransferase involved in cell wall biosynthesis
MRRRRGRLSSRIVARARQPSTLVIGEDALAHSSDVVGELRRRYDLRIIRCPPGAQTSHRELLLRELALMVRLLGTGPVYRRENLMICSTGHYAVLAVSRLLGVVSPPRDVFLYNFYLHRLGQISLVRRILAFLLTRRVVVAAQSQVDYDYFRSVSRNVRIVLVPYGQGPVAGVTSTDVRLGDYVFAGGYTNRDYDRLLRCAKNLAAVQFIIACSSLNTLRESVPANVEILRDLDPVRFHELLAQARLVVVPLADDVGASGQMVTLAAMQLGKPLIVADSDVVTQYVEDGVSGVVYKRTSDASLCNAIANTFDDHERLQSFASAALARYSQRFTKESYDRSLLDALAVSFTDDRGRAEKPRPR